MRKENHSSFIFHTWANFLPRPFTPLERKETRTLLINGISGCLLTHALLGKCAGFSDAPRLSLRLLKAASWCKRLFYGTWQDLSPFSGSLLVCVARVWWGRTGPLWAFVGAGIRVRNFHIPWPLLFLMLRLCCSISVAPLACLALLGPLLGDTGTSWSLRAICRLRANTPILGCWAQPRPPSPTPSVMLPIFSCHVDMALGSEGSFPRGLQLSVGHGRGRGLLALVFTAFLVLIRMLL